MKVIKRWHPSFRIIGRQRRASLSSFSAERNEKKLPSPFSEKTFREHREQRRTEHGVFCDSPPKVAHTQRESARERRPAVGERQEVSSRRSARVARHDRGRAGGGAGRDGEETQPRCLKATTWEEEEEEEEEWVAPVRRWCTPPWAHPSRRGRSSSSAPSAPSSPEVVAPWAEAPSTPCRAV